MSDRKGRFIECKISIGEIVEVAEHIEAGRLSRKNASILIHALWARGESFYLMNEMDENRLNCISFNLAVDEKMNKPPSISMRDAMWLVDMIELMAVLLQSKTEIKE